MSDDEKVVYELELDLPGHPHGAEIQIAGLGTFENGSTYEVTKEEADGYRSYHTSLQYQHDDDGNIVGATAEPGPTLLQAFQSTDGVNVSTVQSSGNNNPPPPQKPADADGKKDEGGDE